MAGAFALRDIRVHLVTLLPLFSKQQEYLPHQHDDLSTLFQSWVGLDPILYALNFLCVLQILRASTPFHQENIIV